MTAPSRAFIYEAELSRVVDGDTIDLVIDMGFRNYTTQRIRLAGLDTPEKNRREQRAAGMAATAAVGGWLENAGQLTVETGKDSGGMGRWVGTIWAENGDCLNDWLLATGWAMPVEKHQHRWTREQLDRIEDL